MFYLNKVYFPWFDWKWKRFINKERGLDEWLLVLLELVFLHLSHVQY